MQLENLRRWFLRQKRDLPWRETNDPYAIWISEIMLQQTQVAVVIPYFDRWMQNFPTIEKLASSDLDNVIKHWEGLGYYSRARNLHSAAKYLMENHGGTLPDTESELLKIKGIGPYTVGAILSFAFHQKKAAVDGNVIRVLSRLFNLHDDISKPKTLKNIQQIAEDILPDVDPWDIAEGLIELGATICTKKPKCSQCPLNATCKATLHGTAEMLPFKSLKIKTENLLRHAYLILADNKVLVKRGEKGKVMSDLYEFPYLPAENINHKNPFGFSIKKVQDLEVVSHSFTRYRVKLSSAIFTTKKTEALPDYEWRSIEELDRLSFSSGHKKLLHQLQTIFPI